MTTIEVKNDYMLGRQNENILYYKCMELEQENKQLKQKIDKAIEYIKECEYHLVIQPQKLLEILGGKENE